MAEFNLDFDRRRTVVHIEGGCLEKTGSLLAADHGPAKAILVTDSNVGPRYADAVAASLRAAGLTANVATVEPGDGSKSLAVASGLYDRLAADRFARDDVVVAVGGGVVSDLAGFVAATWMRGMRFAICPTTLEAAIDASIGGKTAINHPAGKNLIGAFHQPQHVLIDPLCLATLPDRDLVAGLAESVKHGLIRDETFIEWQNSNREAILASDSDTLTELIERNVRIKADVVLADERDQSGVRAALNFGHTVGHAIEAWAGYDLRHGECVSLGMVAAARLSNRLGLLGDVDVERIIAALAGFGLPVALESPPPLDVLMEFIARDKKSARGCVAFVLLNGIGKVVLRTDVPADDVSAVIKSL